MDRYVHEVLDCMKIIAHTRTITQNFKTVKSFSIFFFSPFIRSLIIWLELYVSFAHFHSLLWNNICSHSFSCIFIIQFSSSCVVSVSLCSRQTVTDKIDLFSMMQSDWRANVSKKKPLMQCIMLPNPFRLLPMFVISFSFVYYFLLLVFVLYVVHSFFSSPYFFHSSSLQFVSCLSLTSSLLVN